MTSFQLPKRSQEREASKIPITDVDPDLASDEYVIIQITEREVSKVGLLDIDADHDSDDYVIEKIIERQEVQKQRRSTESSWKKWSDRIMAFALGMVSSLAASFLWEHLPFF